MTMVKSISRKQLLIVFIFIICYAIDIQTQAQKDTARYVFREFAIGEVKMKNGQTDFALMNYNELTEEMIFKKDGGILAIDRLETIDTITIESRIFVPHQKIFLELLVKGPVSLFVQHKCNPIPAGNPSGYGEATETGASKNISVLSYNGRPLNKLKLPSDYHITDETQFWIRRDGAFYKSNTGSQIIKVFPGKAKEIRHFIKENNLNLKNTNDLITLIVKCNEFAYKKQVQKF
jgi:hypothetical protein